MGNEVSKESVTDAWQAAGRHLRDDGGRKRIFDSRRKVPTNEQKGKGSMADMAYCVKCKEKREIKDAHQVTMKNGRAALQGQCPVCGTKLNRILPSSEVKK